MLLDTVKTLCGLFGPTGCEDEVRDYIRREAEPFADQILETPNGALLVFKRGRKRPPQTLMLAAHMDEVGVIVRSVTDKGFLRFAFVGGVDRRVVLGKKVYLGDDRIPGVIGLKPTHLTSRDEERTVPKLESLYIDIGARSKDEALALVRPGDYGCFDGACTDLQNDLIRVKAIDDRVGCAILLETLKKDLPVDTWFAFTVQEEIGVRGAFGAAFAVRPGIAMVVEGTTAADSSLAHGAERVCSPGIGPVISMMDGGAIYDHELFTLLSGIADARGIPWQTKSRIAGGTDARAFQQSAGGCRVCGVSAAVRYIHSPSSVGCTRDFEQMQQLVDGFLEKMEDYNG